MWNAHRLSYTHLDTFDISRYINLSSLPVISYTLHGFCDFSKLAYATVVYISATADIYTTTMLESKKRMAPLKKILFPRLKLCGALLLPQIVHELVPTLNVQLTNVYL